MQRSGPSENARTLYNLALKRRARKAISGLPDDARGRVIHAIEKLRDEPFSSGSRKLRGREGYRVRVGDYRIIYEVNEARRIVTIMQAGHRRDVYRRG